MSQNNLNQKNEQIDDDLVNELSLYARNTSEIYFQKHVPFVKNYRKKMDKGIYNQELAVKGILNNYVPVIVQSYNKEIGQVKPTKVDKMALAQEILAFILSDINEGVGDE